MNRGLELAKKPQALGFQPSMLYVYENKAWEYKRLVRAMAQEGMPTEEEMNTLGEQGWELAGVVGQSDTVYLYFKRLRN